MSKEDYCEIFGTLTRESRNAMAELWDAGVNNSGVWVRYASVEEAVAKIAKAEREKARIDTFGEIIAKCEANNYICHSKEMAKVLRDWAQDGRSR